jgi:hypothetical protein
MFVSTRESTRLHIPEEHRQPHRRENLKSHNRRCLSDYPLHFLAFICPWKSAASGNLEPEPPSPFRQQQSEPPLFKVWTTTATPIPTKTSPKLCMGASVANGRTDNSHSHGGHVNFFILQDVSKSITECFYATFFIRLYA